jgi:hypothetical protein
MSTFIIALILVGIAVVAAHRENKAERRGYDGLDDNNRLLLLHIRQDLKLIAYMLIAISILMGLIAAVPRT